MRKALRRLAPFLAGSLIYFMGPSCSSGEKEQSYTPVVHNYYFDIEAFINKQVKVLDSLKPQVEKEVSFDGKTEQKRLAPRKWSKELSVFKQANINKPVYQGVYQKKVKKDSAGKTVTYKPVQGKHPEVRRLRIFYSDQDIRQITARMRVNNVVYAFERHLRLNFTSGQEHQKPLLKAYYLRNTQKVILLDSNLYRVQANIHY